MALTKIDDRGIKTPIDLLDGEKIRFGTGEDFEIYHHSDNNTYLYEGGSGHLVIKADDLYIQNAAGSQTNIKSASGGAVELSHAGTKKFETASTGCYFDGHVMPGSNGGYDLGLNATRWGDVYIKDDKKIKLGDSNDLEIYHNGTNAYFLNSTGNMIITNMDPDSDNDIHLRARQNEDSLVCRNDGSTDLYHNGSKKFETTSGGVKFTGNLTGDDSNEIRLGTGGDLQLFHDGSNSAIKALNAGHFYNHAQYNHLFVNHNNTENRAVFVDNGTCELYYDGVKKFHTTTSGSQISGHLFMDDDNKVRLGTGQDLEIWHSGTFGRILNSNDDLYVDAVNHYIRADGGNDNSVVCKQNGAVELYYDNSKKLATVSGGVEITNGTLYLNDSYAARFGNDGDLQIYHESGNSFIDSTLAGAQVLIRTKESGGTTNNAAKFMPTGAVELYYDGTKQFETTSTGAVIKKELEIEGAAVNDFESGRIRFTENAHGFLGAYAHYDGSDNVFYLGVHPSDDTTVGNDVNSIKMNRITGSEYVELNYAGSKKLETTSSGITVTGSCSGCDFNFSNMNPDNTPANEVDGTRGSWTLQEGAEDLFLINRNNGKKYKFNLTEVS